MAKVKLGEVAREYKATVKDVVGLPVVGLEHLIPGQVELTQWSEDADNTFTKGFKKGQMLFGRRRAYLKKAALAPFDGVCSGDITVIEAIPERIMPELLPFVIQNDSLFDYAVEKSAGSLSPRVKWEHLKNYEFELPEMEHQSELVDLLWAMARTKKAYQELVKKTDELVKSQFIEMFGDASIGEIKWKKLTVRDAIAEGYINRPLDGNHGEKHPKGDDYVTSGVPFIRAQDLKDKHVDFSSCHFITEKQARTLKKGWAKTGDVLLTHKGTIGRVAVVQPSKYTDMLLTPQITYYRCLRDLDNEYLAAYFATDYFVKQLQSMITGTTRASVTITQQENLELIIPPMEMQHEFVRFVQQSDKSKFELTQAISRIDDMIKALMQG